jgi:hypothetical protein
MVCHAERAFAKGFKNYFCDGRIREDRMDESIEITDLLEPG